jgi:hypothetical protein
LRKLNSRVEARLAETIEACLELEPGARPGSADVVAERLARGRQGLTVKSLALRWWWERFNTPVGLR